MTNLEIVTANSIRYSQTWHRIQHMAVIETRTGRDGRSAFRVKIRLRGYPPQSATFDRLTSAKRWAQATEAAIREGRYFKTPEAKRKTVADLIDRYVAEVLPRKPKSACQQGRQLAWWRKETGHFVLADFSPSAIASARDRLASTPTVRGKQRSPSTVVRYLAVLAHALAVAFKEWCWIDENPMARVSRPREARGRVRFLSPEERSRLLEECKKSPCAPLYTIVVLAVSTGMRRGEIEGLTWDMLDLMKGRIVLPETKNGEYRAVTVAGHALDLLRAWSKTRRIDTRLIFPGSKYGSQARPLVYNKHWIAAVQKAGLSDFRFHDLRHCTASYLAMSGASPTDIAEVLGHKTLQMVKRYSHLSESHTRAIVFDLDKRLFGRIDAELEERGRI